MTQTTNPIVKGLNPAQKKAVEVLSGPLLILAGAGSGKTKCLTHRIANLMANGLNGNNILAVTFTNKAAKEMQARVEKLLLELKHEMGANFEANISRPSLGTFHGICVRILREEIHLLGDGYSRSFVIYDSSDSEKLIKEVMKDLRMDKTTIKHKAVKSHISSAKNQLWSPQKYANMTESNKFTVAVKQIYAEYQKRIRQVNALDFDDLLFRTVEIFEQFPQTLEKYQNRWKSVMIDEYQDTNFAQYRFMRLLVDQHQNIAVIGDDHQSIYRFRGADYTNILNFEKDFPSAKTVKLTQNYRSHGNILKCANSVISYNLTGRQKELWTDTEDGDKVKLHAVADERAEGREIVDLIRHYKEKGLKLKDMVVLYRMNAQSRALEEAFLRAQMPYAIVGGVRFMERKEIKDVLAYLRLIFNPADDIAFLRVVNVPKRAVGNKSLEVIKAYANAYTMPMFHILQNIDEITDLRPAVKKSLKNFYETLNNIREKEASKGLGLLVQTLLKEVKYLEYLNDGSSEGESRIQNVKELFSVVSRYEGADSPLASFLEGVALMSDLDNANLEEDKVTMMTMHASKGLEFPVVFSPAWEDGVFPSHKSHMNDDDMEEERRLAYVCITRAEKHLHLFSASQRTIFGKTEYSSPSKFLTELDETAIERVQRASLYRKTNGLGQKITDASFSFNNQDQKRTMQGQKWGVESNLTEFTTSDKVHHEVFGDGTVIMVNGDVLTIAFAGKGMKKVVASIAPIKKLV